MPKVTAVGQFIKQGDIATELRQHPRKYGHLSLCHKERLPVFPSLLTKDLMPKMTGAI